MSQLVRGIIGAMAVTLGLGVAQLASGGDLAGNISLPAQSLDQDVNRAAKSDRETAGPQVQQGATVSVNLVGQSILVRIPREKLGEARRTPSLITPGARKTVVACEPVVSVLTEVARQLQPGRCVT
jgi:hypothetical protein